MKTRKNDGERRVEEESKAMRRKRIATFGANLYANKLFVYITERKRKRKKEHYVMTCLGDSKNSTKRGLKDLNI